MKVLTLHQPWASLVALGVKTIETRSWSTKYRGPLAIHAGVKKPRNVWAQEPPDLYDPIAMDRYLEISEDVHGSGNFLYEWRGPLGAIVATCTLVDVVPIQSQEYGDHHHRCVIDHLSGRLILLTPGATPVWEEVEDQRPYGDFTPGRYAWLLADIKSWPPVPFTGGQGLTKTWEPAQLARGAA